MKLEKYIFIVTITETHIHCKKLPKIFFVKPKKKKQQKMKYYQQYIIVRKKKEILPTIYLCNRISNAPKVIEFRH